MLTIQNPLFDPNIPTGNQIAKKQQQSNAQQQMQDLVVQRLQITLQSDILQSVLEVFDKSSQDLKSEQGNDAILQTHLKQADALWNTTTTLKTPDQGHVGQTAKSQITSHVGGESLKEETEQWPRRKLIDALINCKPIPAEILQKASIGPLAGFCELYKDRLKLKQQQKTTIPFITLPTTEKNSSLKSSQKPPLIKASDLPTQTDLFADPKKLSPDVKENTLKTPHMKHALTPEDAQEGENKSKKTQKEAFVNKQITDEDKTSKLKDEATSTEKTTGATQSQLGDIPNWKEDPMAWVMGMLNWMMTDRLLPAAYTDLNAFVHLAEIHQSEAQDINLLMSLWMELAGHSKFISSNFANGWNASKGNAAFWAAHQTALARYIRKLHSFFLGAGPGAQITSVLDEMIKKFGGRTTNGTQFQRLKSDFCHAFGTPNAFNDFRSGIKSIYNEMTPRHNGWANLPPAGANEIISEIVKVNNRFDVVFTPKVKRTAWENAFNNFNVSGPWSAFRMDQSQLSNSLATLANDDQNNIRVAFYALTSKVNAATQLLTTVSQMLNQLAQNQRGNG